MQGWFADNVVHLSPEKTMALSLYAQSAQDWFAASCASPILELTEIAGFYGHAVIIKAPPHSCVVKFAFQDGRVAKEIAALQRLRPHSVLPMPEVLASGVRSIGGKDVGMLVLDYLPGKAPWDIQPDAARIVALSDSFVEAMLHLHQQSNPAGYELPDGGFTQSLIAAFSDWNRAAHAYSQAADSPFSPVLRVSLQALWELRHDVLGPIDRDASSLVHDDPHAGNFLFDPVTCLPLAMLDPCDVAFRHREQDLFHLADVRPEWGLFERYVSACTLHAGHEQRRWFFSIWDDVKHSLNRGWYDENWFTAKFDRLAASGVRLGA